MSTLGPHPDQPHTTPGGPPVPDLRPGDGDAERLRIYWTTGVGGQKIRWGVPGDFKRCVALLDPYMPGQAEGYCSNLHLRATGARPGHAATEQRPG